jgi:hypothetical protein
MPFSSESSSSAQKFIEPPPWWTADWDTGFFDTVAVPGLISIEIDRGPKWDRKPVKGQTGETQTFGGWNNADVKIRVRTWTVSQYEAFLATIVPILEPDPGKDAPKEIGIEHPVAAARKVASFRVAKLKGPTANFKEGYSEWEIDAFQAIKKAPAPAGGGGGPAAPGQTPCQAALAAYEHACGEWARANEMAGQLAASGNDSLSDVAAVQEEITRTQNNMFMHAQTLQDLNCSEQSPSSQAAAGDVPPP